MFYFNDGKKGNFEISTEGKNQLLRPPRRGNSDNWTFDKYKGDPPPRQWLVDETFQLGVVSMLTAESGGGKGLLSAHLGLMVAMGETGNNVNRYYQAFGNDVTAQGQPVIFTAEDTKKEIHRRMEQIDPDRVRLHYRRTFAIVPILNAGGIVPLIKPKNGVLEPTDFYHEIKEQLLTFDDLKLVVFDPIASFVQANIDTNEAAGRFTISLLSSLAAETGAAILIVHHLSNDSIDLSIDSAEKAGDLILDTCAIVGGTRAAYALWPAKANYAKTVCRALRLKYEPHKVFKGALIKSNVPGDRTVRTYVRKEGGLLIDQTERIAKYKGESLIKVKY